MARRSTAKNLGSAVKVRVPEAFLQLLAELQTNQSLSPRALALKAGLDEDAIYRIQAGHRPTIVSCILLANVFRHNPNELLELAGWPRLEIFNLPTGLPEDVAELADDLARIQPEAMRHEVVQAIRTLLRQYIL